MNFMERFKKDYEQKSLDLLKKLISYDSTLKSYKENGKEPFGKDLYDILNYLLSYGENDGFIAKNIDNYAGHLEFGEGKDILGILAHLDIVPYKKEEWDTNPLELTIKDGKMFGRGALDDKGGVVAGYIAMEMLLDEGFKPNKRIRLIVGCDEETASRGLKRYLEKEIEPTIAFSPDAGFPCIYGEKAIASYDILSNEGDNVITYFKAGERYNMVPSKAECMLNIDLKDKYLSYLKENNYKGEIKDDKYIAYGISSHGSLPQKGVNAIYILLDFISKYSKSKFADFVRKYFLFDPYGKKIGYSYNDNEMGKLTSNFAILDINDNRIKMGVNLRLPMDGCFELVDQALTVKCEEYNYEYRFINKSGKHFVSKNSELVTALMKSYKDVTGDDTKAYTIGGGTYARELKNAVAFGPCFPGREDTCHIANEYFYQEDFYKSIEIYYNAIRNLCK